MKTKPAEPRGSSGFRNRKSLGSDNPKSTARRSNFQPNWPTNRSGRPVEPERLPAELTFRLRLGEAMKARWRSAA